MKSEIPKQFLEVANIPIIIRTIHCFLNYDTQIKIIISVHKNYKTLLENLLQQFSLRQADIQITVGGETRFHSVKNGLNLIEDENSVVGIHDAARPFVSQQTIKNCFETAAAKGNATPCVSVGESMRKISNNVNHSVNRNEFKIIQTPQCFLTSKIKAAFNQDYTSAFTDDATVLETFGENIHLVEGNEENIKITSPHDLIIANALAKTNESI
ncbi:MAG: 2-C-methyl-D-erythritol 4-phosphate cytidylyltransferase [Bacteroidetes bacterium]|nr:2-C-methyl-D-erythritol 4-phosphate cytidylyltransferase [Bacteroidota bacterium]